ncbi:MAG: DUF1573 domain-containing protein [Candidatus Lloydbacteria bacterium]|nr:DUF1573 domain-containing protein [Candidatus Lloydbacteria bacterium]
MEKQITPIVKVGNVTGYVIVATVLFIALFALFSTNKGDSTSRAETNSAGSLSATEDTFDFGTILMQKGKVSHQFEVKNNGTEAVTIQKIYTSCMCTQAFVIDSAGKRHGAFGMQGHGGVSSQTSIRVDAGATITVEAVFDPAAHGPSGVGLAQRSMYLETNSLSSPQLELTFQAMVAR